MLALGSEPIRQPGAVGGGHMKTQVPREQDVDCPAQRGAPFIQRRRAALELRWPPNVGTLVVCPARARAIGWAGHWRAVLFGLRRMAAWTPKSSCSYEKESITVRRTRDSIYSKQVQ